MVKFSNLEDKIIKLINRHKKGITISKLASKVYESVPETEKPLNPNNSISVTVRQINAKCMRSSLKWYVDGKGLGRNGKTVWINTKIEQHN